MKIALIAVASLLIGFFLSTFFYRQSIVKLNRKVKTLRSKETDDKKKMETMKKVVWVCLANGIAWVWCSYILAYLDKTQIAEGLSQVAVTEIIGVVLAYALKSAVENLSKNNNWPDKPVRPVSDSEQQREENHHG